MKYSPYFKTSEHKPLRKGWYECKCCNYDFWWNGKTWCLDKNKFRLPITELEYWRGMLIKPTK